MAGSFTKQDYIDSMCATPGLLAHLPPECIPPPAADLVML